jgi:ABC-2 type transport system permease protein
MMSSGYLLQGTATEKENKVVEVLLASANADEILAGKLVGLGGAGLLQIATWLVMVLVLTVGVAPLLVAAHVSVPWLALAVAVPFFLVAYLFFGSLMLGSGSLGSTMREAQQYAMVFSLMALVPLMLMSLLITDPHGSVARVLTWVPFSAAPLVVLRASLDPGALAWWEIAGAFAVLVLSTWGAIWLGARLFRIGLLAGGTRVKLRDVIRQARALS